MFETFSRSWEITKLSFSVMKKDKELLLFPLFAGIFSILKTKKIKTELAKTNKELKMLKIQVATLELKRSSLQASLDDLGKGDGVLANK